MTTGRNSSNGNNVYFLRLSKTSYEISSFRSLAFRPFGASTAPQLINFHYGIVFARPIYFSRTYPGFWTSYPYLSRLWPPFFPFSFASITFVSIVRRYAYPSVCVLKRIFSDSLLAGRDLPVMSLLRLRLSRRFRLYRVRVPLYFSSSNISVQKAHSCRIIDYTASDAFDCFFFFITPRFAWKKYQFSPFVLAPVLIHRGPGVPIFARCNQPFLCTFFPARPTFVSEIICVTRASHLKTCIR